MNRLILSSATTASTSPPSPLHLLPPPSLRLIKPRSPLPTPPSKPLLVAHPRTNLVLAHPSSSLPLSPPSTHWLVVMESPPGGPSSKAEVINYYVDTLAKAVGSVRDAQARIYDASWETSFRFCCDVDEETSRRLASLPRVVSVTPDASPKSSKDHKLSGTVSDLLSRTGNQFKKFTPSYSGGNGKHWLVRMEKSGVEVATKAQMVDFYAEILTKVLHNEKEAQASLYSISWKKNLGFCCHIDEDCARKLADVEGVLSVSPDLHYGSENKDYGGTAPLQREVNSIDSSTSKQRENAKRLFVTGLSFYTTEKTLRAAFEGFGELVEVKVIMDNISKRSKGYAFLEYTTEAAAAAAKEEMNGKIINGWMIVVDVARSTPRTAKGHSSSFNSASSSSSTRFKQRSIST